MLRRILDASIDHRQASLLLYGLQIAAANIKLTRFRPSYSDVIRSLPAEAGAAVPPLPGANASPHESSAAVPAAVAAGEPALSEVEGPAADAGELAFETPAPARPGRPRDSRQDAGATSNAPASSPASPSPAPSLLTADPQPSTTAEGREPTTDSSRLPTDPCPPATASNHCPLTTNAVAPPRNKRPSRRLRTSSLATDNWQLATVKPALSQMFQREVRRHLARLNFPASPDPDPEI
ncbi:MAG: hypothetical protein ACM3PW_08035 [Chlamydiota bacterium]